MEQKIEISHQRITIKKNFENFTKDFEVTVNPLDPGWAKNILENPEAVANELHKVAASTGLMIFGTQPHGDLMLFIGQSRKKATQYIIGNPLVAIEMTKYDIRAALYAPLRMVVFEDTDGVTYVEYDLPSTLFGQFGNPDVTNVALGLDAKLLNAIQLADD